MEGSVLQNACILQTLITWMFIAAVALCGLPFAVGKIMETARIITAGVKEIQAAHPETSHTPAEEISQALLADEIESLDPRPGGRRRR